MLALQVGLAVALLVVCCFAPGFFFIRRLHWSPMEKLCGSVGLSLILLYLASWEDYCVAPGVETGASYGLTIVSVVLGVLARKDLFRLIGCSRVRHALFGYSFLFAWTLLILSMIRNYSGASWQGDWLGHFQIALFFLHHFPAGTPIFARAAYPLPAHPPMMNVLGAFFLSQTAERFEVFQVIFTFLNLLVFLPCCLIMPALAKPRKLHLLPLAVLFAVNPVVMETATYTWTKSLTAFFVVLGLWFYSAGWRKNDFGRMTAAFVALSAGFLVHYSAGPYCLFVGLHYLLCVFRKRERKWREVAIITTTCSLLLLTWFGWSVASYGTHATVASNSSVADIQPYPGGNMERIAANLYDSIVPRVLQDRQAVHAWDQPNLAGAVRDNAFIFYQANLIFAMGLTAGPLVLGLLYGVFRRRIDAEGRFWRAMIPFCVIVGIAVVGERDPWGLAHATLLSLEVLGVSLLAAAFPLRRLAAVALMAGCVADFSLGVFLQARVQNLQNAAQKMVFPWDDDIHWQQWSARHGGSIDFLGDHLANSWFGVLDVQSVLLLLIFLGVVGVLWKGVVRV